jgi:cyanophycinase
MQLRSNRWITYLVALGCLPLATWACQKYEYVRTGNPSDKVTHTSFGLALIGGGPEMDEAIRWVCKKSGGGDVLVITAISSKHNEVSKYVEDRCKQNSISTLVISGRAAAADPFVAKTIRHAAAVLIDGGDQSDYVNFWKDTPVQEAMNEAMHRNIPVGGTSAGLAILGEFSFSGLNGSAISDEVVQNPYHDTVTISRNFIRAPDMSKIVTDTHFVKRDRLGRLIVFMARVMCDGFSREVRGIGIDENSAVLLGADGIAKIVGTGRGAYFLDASETPRVCKPGEPLTFRGIDVEQVPSGGSFNLRSWQGDRARSYTIDLTGGTLSLRSTFY